MLDEESSEEEQEKFFNADREPEQPPKSGCCSGVGVMLLSLILIGVLIFLLIS